jgi:hypothetical protein
MAILMRVEVHRGSQFSDRVLLADNSTTMVGSAPSGTTTVAIPVSGVAPDLCSISCSYGKAQLQLCPDLRSHIVAKHGTVGIGQHEPVALRSGSVVCIGDVNLTFEFIPVHQANSRTVLGGEHNATTSQRSPTHDNGVAVASNTDRAMNAQLTGVNRVPVGDVTPNSLAVGQLASAPVAVVSVADQSPAAPTEWTALSSPSSNYSEVFHRLDTLPVELLQQHTFRAAKGYLPVPSDGSFLNDTIQTFREDLTRRSGPVYSNKPIATQVWKCNCSVTGCRAAQKAHSGRQCDLKVRIAVYKSVVHSGKSALVAYNAVVEYSPFGFATFFGISILVIFCLRPEKWKVGTR